jgi:hypothetical protein
MIIVILLVIFGIIALTRNEVKITNKRRVSGSNSKLLGAIMLVGAVAGFFINGAGLVALIIVIVVGLIVAEPVPA